MLDFEESWTGCVVSGAESNCCRGQKINARASIITVMMIPRMFVRVSHSVDLACHFAHHDQLQSDHVTDSFTTHWLDREEVICFDRVEAVQLVFQCVLLDKQ